MKPPLILATLAAAALTSGCSVLPGHSSVSGDWSCRAVGVSACHSIAHNDIVNDDPSIGSHQAVPASSPTAGVYDFDRPILFGRHVMRVSIAAWIDVNGHYHAPATVFAPTGEEIWGLPAQSGVER